MIELEPMGGLANKMRVIASGLVLIKNSIRKLCVIWNLNEDLNCEFDVLFMPIQGVSIIEKERKYIFAHHSFNPILYKKIKAFFRNKLLGRDYFINEMNLLKARISHGFIEKIVYKDKNNYIKTTQSCASFDDEINQYRPSKSVQKLIDEQVSKFNAYIIGLHIRRSDNEISILNSHLYLFEEKIRKELEKNDLANFYLAKYDLDVEEKLVAIYGKSIIVREKELSRNNKKGIIDALIDMFCLSKTKYIYGSYWSSFSRMASLLGDVKLNVLKDN